MMRKTLMAALLAAAAAFPAGAQSRIEAATDTVAFGFIRETEGPKTVRTYVKNTGTDTLAVLKVRPTCGCTAADFMKADIAPGDSAWIDLTYHPYRRPGKFEKAVKIYPTKGEMIRIPITGTVISSAETIANFFPSDGGLLYLSETTLMPLKKLKDEIVSLFIDAYNGGETPVYALLECDSEAVTTELFPAKVGPGERALLGIYINPYKEPRSGKLEYTLHLYTSTSPILPLSSSPLLSDSSYPLLSDSNTEIKVIIEK